MSPYAAPARAADLAGLPPTYIDCASLEVFRDEDVEYARRLRLAGVPVELHVYPGAFHGSNNSVSRSDLSRRWKADERGFAMPIKAGDPAKWQMLQPTTDWKSMEWSAGKDAFKVATELFYVNVAILGANGRP